MRILVGIAAGLGIEVLFLANILGWLRWCPDFVFAVLHYLSMVAASRLFPGEAGFWSSLLFVTVQWPLLGALVGLVLHLRHKAANPSLQRTPGSASGSNSGTSGPAPLS